LADSYLIRSAVSVIADSSEYANWVRELVLTATKTPRCIWQTAHGPDWEQVVEADSAMLIRLMDSRCDIYEDRLGKVACPVLLTASLVDEMLPEVGVRLTDMADHIPDCRLFLTNQGNHPLMWSRPDDFRASSDLFLNTIS
jgi:pimeloyl-ACP methyl ester carboxylesterase